MPLDSGRPLIDIQPIQPAGRTKKGHRMYGTHRGRGAQFNVVNPRPGFVYFWGRREIGDLRRYAMQGWEVVPPDSPERRYDEEPYLRNAGLDGAQNVQDVVLLRMPEEKYAELDAYRREQARIAREGSTTEYISKGRQFGRYVELADGDIYYRSRGHHGPRRTDT